MHTTSTRRSLVICLMILSLTLASCSSAALVVGNPPESAVEPSGIFGGESNQVPDAAKTRSDGRTVFGGEMNQIPAAARTAPEPHESPET
jgi:hypothetical protein